MFPSDFAYVRARSLDEALDLLDEAAQAGDEAKLIAGGQSLLPMMKLRLAAPQVLIDIAGIERLQQGAFYGSSHTIGALTTYRQLGRQRFVPRDAAPGRTLSLTESVPALADALAVLADPQVRARGTIGGAVAHGDPASDLPAVLLALDAEVRIAGRPGRHQHKASPGGPYPPRVRGQDKESAVDGQTMLLDDFLQGIYATDLADDEVVTSIRIDTQGAQASAYEKFPHPASHLPLAGVAVVVTFKSGQLTDKDGRVISRADGRIAHAAVAVTGISPRPYRARAAEAVLKDALPTAETLAAAAARVTMESPDSPGRVSLLGDQHASAGYRAHLAEVLTRRALAKAVNRGGRNS